MLLRHDAQYQRIVKEAEEKAAADKLKKENEKLAQKKKGPTPAEEGEGSMSVDAKGAPSPQEQSAAAEAFLLSSKRITNVNQDCSSSGCLSQGA